jgi:flavin reductase (DIM6/NTAB) family NADH-FMN oxidoreductase RutF
MPGLDIAGAAAPDFRARFIDGMSFAACSVSVVTTDGIAGRFGVTVSAMSSVSADGNRPTLLACVHHKSRAAAAIIENGVFCVNVLRDDQSHIADCFAGRRPLDNGDKFSCARWVRESTGAPRVVDPLVAFDCRLISANQVGTHHVLFGAVETIFIAGAGSPLIYANRAYGKAQRIEPTAPARSMAPPDARSRLVVGCYQVFAPYVMPALLSRMSASHADSILSCVDGDQHRILDDLKSGETDVALLYDFNLDADVEAVPLAEWQPYVLLPGGHHLAARDTIALDELAPEPLVELDLHPSRNYFRSLFHAAGLTPRLGISARSFEMVRGLVAHGFGYSLLATKPTNSMSYDGRAVVARHLSTPVEPSRLVLGSRVGADIHPLAEAFRETCKAYFTRSAARDIDHGP